MMKGFKKGDRVKLTPKARQVGLYPSLKGDVFGTVTSDQKSSLVSVRRDTNKTAHSMHEDFWDLISTAPPEELTSYVTVKVSASLLARLDMTADALKITRAEMVRRALTKYF